MSRILVFDSGVGGMTVLHRIERLLPALDLVYLADDRHFPYGDRDEDDLTARILSVMEDAIAEYRPDAVVIACNTASTLVLPPLRDRFAIPFVGTVPAIKPAAEKTRTGQVSVLATSGTIRRDYTRALIEQFAATVDVTLVASDALAGLAETKLRGEPVDEHVLASEVSPCFIEHFNGPTDHVVLACTHFPLLLPELRRCAPWPVAWIDPGEAIARRVGSVIAAPPEQTSGARLFVTTSGRPLTVDMSGISV